MERPILERHLMEQDLLLQDRSSSRREDDELFNDVIEVIELCSFKPSFAP
jgi:hypothetical protein